MGRLFIIGNGFDCAHGNHTAYRYFRDWMLEQLREMGVSEEQMEELPEIPFAGMGNHELEYDRQELMKFLMWLLQYGSDMDEEWNQFESALAKLKLQGIFDENTWPVRENTVESDGYEDDLHGDPFKRAQDYEMYAAAIKEALQMIPELFAQWIRTVKLSKKKISFGWDIICENSPAHHRPDDLFLVFNYTETLESLYHVPENQICHIHGKRNCGEKLIIGHGEDKLQGFENEDPLAVDLLEQAIRGLKKDTEHVIAAHEDFWNKISQTEITDIYSFGFSYGDVDLPYIQRVIQCLKSDGQNVTWHWNQYDHGEKNEQYTRKILEVGFGGNFTEYDNSKMLLSTDEIVPIVLDSFDRNEEYTFYYDETNYFGKFWMKQNKRGTYEFNCDIDKDFVLAGLVVKPESAILDHEMLWKRLNLSPQVHELKFNKQFSMGDFVQTLGKGKLNQLLHVIDEHGYHIHVAHMNAFYYSIVDIVDSAVNLDDIIEYRGTANLNLQYEVNRLKAQLFDVLYPHRNEVEQLFHTYGYPDLNKEDMDEFSQKLVQFFGSRRELSMDLKFLSGMIRKAGAEKNLIFLEDNTRDVMIENLAFLYLHFTVLFPESYHIFDNQKEVKRKLDTYELIDRDQRKLDNYEYADSKDNLLIQVSDVISGIYGMLYEFINEHDKNGIRKMVDSLNETQLDSLWMMVKLMCESEIENKGFIFSLASIKGNEKWQLIMQLVCKKKG